MEEEGENSHKDKCELAVPDSTIPVPPTKDRRKLKTDALQLLPLRSEESVEGTSSETPIPHMTSYWDEEVLDLLRISADRSHLFQPNELIESWLRSVVSRKSIAREDFEARASKVIEHFNSYKPICRLDIDNVYDISQTVRGACPGPLSYFNFLRTEDGCSVWTSGMASFDKHWDHMFKNNADEFIRDLKYMVLVHEMDGNIPESLYCDLFQHFIGMFGLHSRSSFRTRYMNIGNVKVTSVPDIMVMDELLQREENTPGVEMKILMLIQAKKKYTDPYNPTPAKTRSKSSQKSKVDKEFNIDHKLIGQLVGEMLTYLPLSSDSDGILGMAVEESHVKFAYFKCSKMQYEIIKNGGCSFPGGKPTIKFSRSYNFLKAADREHLIEPLLKLGLLQRIQ